MKEQMLSVEEYDVEDLYHETGWAQSLARNDRFKNLAFFVIALNTIWLAIDTDYNIANDIVVLSQAEWRVQLIENLFCAFFVFEISTRFLACKHKFKDVGCG